jgi:hypothetical protein
MDAQRLFKSSLARPAAATQPRDAAGFLQRVIFAGQTCEMFTRRKQLAGAKSLRG